MNNCVVGFKQSEVGKCRSDIKLRRVVPYARHRGHCGMSRPVVLLPTTAVPFPVAPFSFHLHVHPMKLTFRRALRPRPFSSMLGFLDLKTGVTLVVLFAVRTLNPNFFSLSLLILVLSSGAQQGRWYLRPHCFAHRSRWKRCTTHPIHLLCPRPHRSLVGNSCRQ